MATREQDRQKIYNFLLHKGADKFWTNSALKHIMLNFAGNNYWLTNIRNLKAIIVEFGMVKKFTMICTINTVSKKLNGRLVYRFDGPHSVQINQI